MIYKVENIDYKPIGRISPSQFYSMKNCAYKSLLAEAFDKKPLLPVSPNAYFGTVLHKMLELISKGIIKDEEEFNSQFEKEVNFVESILVEKGHDFLVPLQINVKDFGLKKVLIKKHLRSFSDRPLPENDVKFNSEKWFESKDKLIGGKIDLVIQNGANTEIIDFKTGAVTEEMLDDDGEVLSEVKQTYQEQLKLYAYLFFETVGNFPTRLSLVDVAKQKFNVEFTESACEDLFEEAKKLLVATNDSIISKEYNANPNKTNCKYCLYRPACTFYIKQLEQGSAGFSDCSGYVKNVICYLNGSVSVELENQNETLTINNFPTSMLQGLKDRKDETISTFNLRKTGVELVYSCTKTTQVYG